MRAAFEAGIKVPKLCATDSLSLLARAEFVWLRLKVDAVTLVMHHAC